ncbi:hypothetical protein J7E93_17315 [Streptomyces sp. ISL-36]|uniref:hypothetical protein n=1 Tax=Streptomyces sp. ISL-36 TaxID=2819182 RepID=UPI001BEC69E3|nr:hypothetical protein [Streptomyces sp. ISL-36]MBT2441838.1 hypothetical protein [Streptomyces sp. ISL-36]
MRATKKDMWTTHHFSLGIPAGSGQGVADLLRTVADRIEKLGEKWDVFAVGVGGLDSEDPSSTAYVSVFADPASRSGA